MTADEIIRMYGKRMLCSSRFLSASILNQLLYFGKNKTYPNIKPDGKSDIDAVKIHTHTQVLIENFYIIPSPFLNFTH